MVDRTIVYRLQADVAAAEANMRHFGATVRSTANDITAANKQDESFRRGLNTLGDQAGKVGLAAAAGLGASIKAAVDWESAWAGVSKTVDGTAKQMGALEDELRELARTMPATHEEIAATAEAAGQLGVAREDIVAFTKTMVQLGETTNLTSDDAATSIAQFMNVMKSSAADVDEIGNTLVDLGNKGASTEAQILNMAQRLSGAGSLVGATEQDVLALASAMSNLGVQAELGGGAIQRVFTNIYQAAADGADGLAGFAEVAGMSAQDFAEDWANDPVRAFDAFLQGLGRIKDSGGNVVGTLDDLGIKGTQNLQVMLRLAGAGDMLTTSLDQSNSAWEQNTALTDEYGKRAETTASQAQVAWNQIKDAGIEAGNGLLPVVAEIAGTVGGLANAFGELPGPVKSATTGMLGVTAVLGGGLWFTAKTVSGVANMREALANLNVTADGTTSKLGGLARAGVGLGVIATVIPIIKGLQEAGDESLPGIESLTNRLLDLQDLGTKGFSVSIGEEFDSLGTSIERLTDKSKDLAASDAIGATIGVQSRGLRDATREVELLDQALAQITSTAGPDVAEQILGGLVEQGYLTEAQLEAVRGELDAYDEALAGVENQSKLTDGATDGMTGATASLGDVLGEAATQAEDFGDKLDRLNEKLSGRADMRSYQAAIDDFSKSIKENGRTFDINTEKGRNNQAMLDNIAGTALTVAENLEGAARKRFLTNAIDDLRTMGKQMGLPKQEINALIALLREANRTNVEPTVDVDTGQSLAKIAAVRNSIESLRDRDLTITTVYKVVRNAGDAVPYRGEADGGLLDFYANGGMRENHVAQIAPAGAWRVWAEPETGGEAYIPLAPSKRDRSVDIWEQVGARLGVSFARFADGGVVSKKAKKKVKATGELDSNLEFGPSRGDLLALLLAAQTQAAAANDQRFAADAAAQAAADQLEAAQTGADNAEQNLRAAESLQDSFRDSVASQFSGSLTGGGLAGLMQTLGRDINASGSMDATLQALVGAGLDVTGPAAGLYRELAASEDLTTANELLAGGPELIAMLEQQYAQRDAINAQRAETAAQNAYGPMVAEQQQLNALAQAQLAQAQAAAAQADFRLEQVVGRLQTLEGAVDRQADQLADAINSTVRPGRRG